MAYTTIDDPSIYFHTQLYAGNGNDDRSITNDANAGNFKPDWLWLKNRSGTNSHALVDSTRGPTKVLRSNATNAEETEANGIQAFETDGFQIGSGGLVNTDGNNYVAWQWIANGGTTTINDASSTSVGTIDSVYQANTTAGFSIVTYTGTTSAGTIAHGLGAVPKMIIIKNRDDGAENWAVYHAGIASDAETDYIYLDSNNAASDDANLFNDTAPTSTVFSIGTSGVVNQAEAHIAYCFAEKQGYSKLGSYEANNSTDGTFIYTGFKPAWVILKCVDSAGNWFLYDKARDSSNMVTQTLYGDLNAAENTESNGLDFLSNGIKLRQSGSGGINHSGTYIYMAFAEHPFVSSEGTLTTAR